jgi:hypothetical protein
MNCSRYIKANEPRVMNAAWKAENAKAKAMSKRTTAPMRATLESATNRRARKYLQRNK